MECMGSFTHLATHGEEMEEEDESWIMNGTRTRINTRIEWLGFWFGLGYLAL